MKFRNPPCSLTKMTISPIQFLRQSSTNPASLRDPNPGARSPLASFLTPQDSDELCIEPSIRSIGIASVSVSAEWPGNASGGEREGQDNELGEGELSQCSTPALHTTSFHLLHVQSFPAVLHHPSSPVENEGTDQASSLKNSLPIHLSSMDLPDHRQRCQRTHSLY